MIAAESFYEPVMATSSDGLAMFRLQIPLIISVLAIGSRVPAAQVEPAASIEELSKRVRSHLDDAEVPGLIGAIVYGDEIIWQAAIGVADRQSNRPVTNDTLFRIGSVSKTFVSLSVIKLVEDGRMKLSEPIRRLAPEAGVINHWESTHPVELVHVLEHTAPLFNVARTFKVRREVGWFAWHHSLVASIALVILAGFLAASGLVGLRTWAY